MSEASWRDETVGFLSLRLFAVCDRGGVEGFANNSLWWRLRGTRESRTLPFIQLSASVSKHRGLLPVRYVNRINKRKHGMVCRNAKWVFGNQLAKA